MLDEVQKSRVIRALEQIALCLEFITLAALLWTALLTFSAPTIFSALTKIAHGAP